MENPTVSFPSSESLCLWQSIEAFRDRLAEAASLPELGEQALLYALETSGRQAGVLLLQMPEEDDPVAILQQGLHDGWDVQIMDPASPLRQLSQQVIHKELNLTAAEIAGLAAAVPILGRDEGFGVLLIQGAPGSAEEHTWLVQVSAILGRAIEDWLADRIQGRMLYSYKMLRVLFDHVPAAMYIIDPGYRLQAVNQSCAQRVGKTPRMLVGQTCYTALYGRTGRCPGCQVSDTFRNGASSRRNEFRPGPGEAPVEWEISAIPICSEPGQVMQAILMEQDVTEMRQLENILVQSEKLAAVGQLAAGVAHEINNPLTAIIANAQILQRELAWNKDLRESVELIARAGERATQVVRNLLDFARQEEHHLSRTDINDTLKRALALVQHELLARSIILVFDPDPNLPMVLASQDDLLGVWLNVLMNAMDALDKAQPRLYISTRQAGNQVEVVIADNGKGIPAEQVTRIFEPFYTTKAPGHGTGLGLSVCQRIIQQHGGSIQVESQVGVGTQFKVILPVSKVQGSSAVSR